MEIEQTAPAGAGVHLGTAVEAAAGALLGGATCLEAIALVDQLHARRSDTE